MTQEKMEGHGPHGHSYVWDAQMKRREREKTVLLAMYIGGRVVHEKEKR